MGEPGANRPAAAAHERQARYRRGRWSETLAASLLLLKGYRILARRYRTRVGEIDIIALRGRRLAFVEVKLRRSLPEAMTSIAPRQQRRMLRAAEHWIARHPRFAHHEIGLDIVLIAPRRWPRHFPNVFPHDMGGPAGRR